MDTQTLGIQVLSLSIRSGEQFFFHSSFLTHFEAILPRIKPYLASIPATAKMLFYR